MKTRHHHRCHCRHRAKRQNRRVSRASWNVPRLQCRTDSMIEICGDYPVHPRAQLPINGPQQHLLRTQRLAAVQAGFHMFKDHAWQNRAARRRLDQRLFVFVANHCNFSANFFLPTNSRDFTVPTGNRSIAATSSNVWPSIAASSSTSRNFSGNPSIAASKCAWNSLEAASSSAFGGTSRRAGCDHSVSRNSRRFVERARSSASRNTIRTSHPRNRSGSRNPSNRLYARNSASCAMSSASASFRMTPRATRYASGPHSASRASNSRRLAACAASSFHSDSAARIGWIRTSSCIPFHARANRARPPVTPTRRRGTFRGSPGTDNWLNLCTDTEQLICDGVQEWNLPLSLSFKMALMAWRRLVGRSNPLALLS